MSLYAGLKFSKGGPVEVPGASSSAPGVAAEPTASTSASPSASPAPSEAQSAAEKAKPATWSAALRFAPVARKKPTKPASSSVPSAFTAAFASAEESNAPPARLGPRIVGPSKVALSSMPDAAAPPKGRFGSATSRGPEPVPPPSQSASASTSAPPAAPERPLVQRVGRTLAAPPSMTLDGEEDVNGFKQTSAGQRAEKRKAHAGKGRGRKDPALLFGDQVYDPSRPCDYSAYKAHLLALRTQRRLEAEEKRRRERSPSGSSYESDSEGEQSAEDTNTKKARLFAPPSSYDDPPRPSFGQAQPPEPAFTPAIPVPAGDRSLAPREETGEEAYLRRLAMSSKPAAAPAQPPPRPAYPAFAPASQPQAPPSFVSSATTGPPASYNAPPPPPPPAPAPVLSYPPPPPPGFKPPTFFAPPGIGADDFPPFQAPPPPPPPPAAAPASNAVADAQARAREIALRLSKLQGIQQPPSPAPVATPTPPPAPAAPEEPDHRPFADRMMSKFGWEAGKGLGASESGMTTALSVARAPSAAATKRAVAKAKAKGEEPPSKEQPKGMAGSRAKVVDSSREVRLEAERQSRGGDPSRVVLLTNLCGLEEVDDDLSGEIAEEANKFGVVERCFVYIVPGETRTEEQVRIFLVMSGLAGGYNAVRQFDGRFFGGRVVKARFYDENSFNAGQHRL